MQIVHFSLYNIAFGLIPVFFVIYIVLAQGMYLCGVSVPVIYYRNFLILGFSFFMLGNWLRRNESMVNKWLTNRILWSLVAVFTVACLGERYLLGRDFGVNISTFPQVVLIFILCMRNSFSSLNHPLSYIGAKLSMYVYIIHVFVIFIINHAYRFLHLANNSSVFLYLRPVLVVFVTLLLSYSIVLIIEFACKKQTGSA